MTRKILILGAGGFVGRALVARLAADGAMTPVAAGRHAAAATAGVESVRLDATDTAALQAVLPGVEGVVNCVAGAPSVMIRNAEVLQQLLVQERFRHIRLVHFSSMAAYGLATGKVTESASLRGDAGPYSQAKAQTEALLQSLPKASILRPGCIYGPGSVQWSFRIAALLRARRLGDLGAAGDGHSNLVYIDDVVEAVVRALSRESAAGQAFNLAMRDAPRWNEYFIAYARLLRAVPVRRIPGWQLAAERKLIAPAMKICEIAGRKLGLKTAVPILTPSMLALWRQDIELQVNHAESVLGLAWTPLDTGMRRAEGQP